MTEPVTRDVVRKIATAARSAALGYSQQFWPDEQWHYGPRVTAIEDFEAEVLMHLCIKRALEHWERRR